MTSSSDVIRLRLANHGLTAKTARCPEEIVAHLGAVQAQDFGMAKWALGLRGSGLGEQEVAAAFDSGRILRTHMLRPTWHFVTPSDIRPLLRLTAPRVRAALAHNDRAHGIDGALVRRSQRILLRSLSEGFHTREELQDRLEREGIKVDGVGLAHVMMHAELDELVCSGPRRGKAFTYALLDRRADAVSKFNHTAALAELAQRYFRSHGPATARDFSWWSGLTLRDARAGIEALGAGFDRLSLEDKDFWFARDSAAGRGDEAWLLPNYDEYTVAYADRSFLMESNRIKHAIFSNVIVVNGLVAGTWRRTVAGKDVKVALDPFEPLSPRNRRAVDRAVGHYRAFLADANAETHAECRKPRP